VPTDSINLGISIPTNFGSPSVAAPSVVDSVSTVTRTGTGLTNTISNSVPGPGDTLAAVGNNGRQAVPGSRGLQTRRSGVPPLGERRFVPNEVVVRLPSNLSPDALDALARRHGLTRLETQRIGLTGGTLHRWRIADGRPVADVIRAIESEAGVSAAQPN